MCYESSTSSAIPAALSVAAGAYNAIHDAIVKTNNDVPRRFSHFSEKQKNLNNVSTWRIPKTSGRIIYI